MAATIADVAKEAGVGVGTVSRVLNGGKSVSANTREAVEQAMDRLKYNRNSIAKRLREQKSGIIALMIPVVYHPFFAQFAENVERAADKYGYSVLLVASQQCVRKESDMLDRIKRREVDGDIRNAFRARRCRVFGMSVGVHRQTSRRRRSVCDER